MIGIRCAVSCLAAQPWRCPLRFVLSCRYLRSHESTTNYATLTTLILPVHQQHFRSYVVPGSLVVQGMIAESRPEPLPVDSYTEVRQPERSHHCRCPPTEPSTVVLLVHMSEGRRLGPIVAPARRSLLSRYSTEMWSVLNWVGYATGSLDSSISRDGRKRKSSERRFTHSHLVRVSMTMTSG